MTTRNLQITIFEAPPGTGRRGRSGGSRGPGFDPEDNYVKPPPEDPEDNYVKPPPEDPEDNYVKPPPEDPEDNYVKPPPEDPGSPWPGGHPASGPQPAWVAAQYLPPGAAPAQGCCCSPCSCDQSKTPERPCVAPGDYSGFIIVRVAPGVGPLTVDSLWELAEAAGLEGLKAVLAAPLLDDGESGGQTGSGAGERRGRGGVGALRRFLGELLPPHEGEPAPQEPAGVLVSRPLVQLRCRNRRSTVEAIECLENAAARTGFRPRHGLARYWRVDLRAFPDLIAEVLDRCNELPEVDLAYRELRTLDTYGPTSTTGESLGGDQAYFDPAPVGIGARWLWDSMSTAQQTGGSQPLLTVIDLEQGWTVGHLELQQSLNQPDLLVHGENRQDDEPGAGNHGTAVLGQLAAAGVGAFGVKGSATDVADFRLASHYREKQTPPTLDNPFPGTNGHVASAIVNCLIGPNNVPSPLGTGDVLLLEVQRGRLPTETDEADFDAIRLATAVGVIVVEAAGNGNYDLDRCGDPQTGRTLQRGNAGFIDSGAILVGASFADLPHDRAPFSNYGSRVDCYGWGEGVTTCGYGDLHDGGGPNEYYTNTFNGTSSAAPIIAGAAGLVQALHLRSTSDLLQPLPMRALLASRATGTPQGPNVGGHIGVMPDLRAIVRGTLQLVPDVYIRRSPCDDGSRRGPGDEISSSPDIVVLDPAHPHKALGEKSASAHHPAPGETRLVGGEVYVRLRNRGLGDGMAGASSEVLLYAAPAATLIAPDGWESIGAAVVPAVPPGDTLRVSKLLNWDAPPFPVAAPPWPAQAVRAYSFLAVFDPDGAALPHPIRALPPGPPYFDWRRYLRFLRGAGVAWRNVHPIGLGAGADLAFYLTGTPDRAREFDLEVIQRLPASAKVALHLPRALASKLHQRQPGLGLTANGATASLTLPRRRSTRFSRLRLPCGLRAPAWLEVTATSPKLSEGHSLAIRQLWRGEEVGRITWYVTGGVP
jgi:subtilisin family serine protease